MAFIVIEVARDADLPGVVDIYNQVLATSHANFDTKPSTVDDRKPWFAQFAATGPHRLLVARHGAVVIGYASSGRYRDHEAFSETVEFSVSLASEWRGQRIGSKLYTRLIDELEHEPVHVAVAGIALPNDASIALHKRFGFVEVGVFHEYAIKQGRYLSSIWLQRTFPGPA